MSRTMQDIPIARRGDPVSSHLAAEDITSSGLRETQWKAVLRGVELHRHEGGTSLEIARSINLDRYIVARRLPELEAAGLIHRGEMRTCVVSPSNRLSVTWWPGAAPKPPVEVEQGKLL